MTKKDETVEKKVKSFDIEVGDPQVLRPRELPLVVKPADGAEWQNDAQERFAGFLNAYAYKNPEKWEKKKEALVDQLKELGKNPGLLSVLTGGEEQNLNYKNHITQK